MVRILEGPYRRKRLRLWHRLHRALAWIFGGQGR